MPETPGTHLHLVIDPGPAAAGEAPGPRTMRAVRVPPGVCWLRNGTTPQRLLARTPVAGSPMLEPLTGGAEPLLVMLSPRGAGIPRVNGRRTPRIRLLRVADQLLLDDGRLLHVTAYDVPQVGPPPGGTDTGARCPVCRTGFDGHDRAVRCACGQALHHDDDSVPESRRLQCASLVAGCPACRQSIRLDGGFRHVPDPD